jgi:hypothetical protein
MWYCCIQGYFFTMPVWELNRLKHGGYYIHCCVNIEYILPTRFTLLICFVRF